MNQSVDSKAVAVTFLTKIPYLILWGLVGAILGSGLNLVIKTFENRETTYYAVEKFYITFTYDWSKDYYNDYTWNDIMTTDPILGTAMESISGATRQEVEEMVTARIYSDARYLTVEFTGHDEEVLREVYEAYETSVVNFADKVDEITSIECIQLGDTRVESVSWLTWRACVLGCILAVIIYILVFLWKFNLGDRVYTLWDVEEILGLDGYGIEEAKEYEELNVNASLEDIKKLSGKTVILNFQQGKPCVRTAVELLRVADKNSVDIIGAKLTGCSKTWLKLYGIKNIDGVYGVR